MVAVGGQHTELDGLMRQFDGMKSARVDFDRKWQMASDHILPRRDFSVTQRPNQLRPHRVTSSVATNANTRFAALVLTYLIDPTRPFLAPNVKRGLVAAGRSTNLDDDALDYLSAVQWDIFSHMTLERAKLMVRLNSMLKEYGCFGNGVLWTGRKRGFGPYFNVRPIQACWWSENEEGDIDTLFFKLMLPVWRVFQRWPEARAVWKAGDDDDRSELELTPIVLACRPRLGGVRGAVAEAKPFAYIAYSEEKKAILERSGYDSFPYAVFRYDPMPGNAYSEGPGCQVLPDVMVLNHLQEAIENAASQKASPPLAMPARMFSKLLDRRPGAVNLYNAAGLGLARADQAILKLDFTGDVQQAVEFKKTLIDDIELGYFTDWMRLREAGDMTAEEVGERRDLRLRGMSSIVAGLGQPMTSLGDRALEIMNEEALLAPAPPQLARVDVDWEYAGPLALAQLRGNAQSILQLVNAQALVAKADPDAADAVDLEECMRILAEALAAPPNATRSRAVVKQRAAARAQAAQQQQDVQNAALAAKAANDGTGAIGNLAGAAADVAGAGSPQAPFAPAAPFAQPIAA